jgi:hypothetical protein
MSALRGYGCQQIAHYLALFYEKRCSTLELLLDISIEFQGVVERFKSGLRAFRWRSCGFGLSGASGQFTQLRADF